MQQQATWTKSRNQPMSDWSAMLRPRVCENCGRETTPTGVDWFEPWNNLVNAPMLKEWSRVWEGMFGTWTPPRAGGRQGVRDSRTHEKHSDCCSSCEPDDCHCRCCVVNADLIVYARVGEHRVVPITIENHIRRAREVELQLSEWTTHRKEAIKVEALVAGESKFSLEPCGERQVILIVRTLSDSIKPNPSNEASSTDKTTADYASKLADQRARELADVGECTVFYADLRVVGCDIRPIRIALAILPRDCGDYRVDCKCGCCC